METEKKGSSFSTLPVSERLVELIERNAEELAWNWLQDMRKRDDMPTYQTYNENALYERAFRVFSQLRKWISRETTKEEIASQYMDLGAQRRKEGFALSEVIQALILTRNQIWLKVQTEGLLDTALDLSQAIELNIRVLRFFDQAICYAARGYEKKG